MARMMRPKEKAVRQVNTVNISSDSFTSQNVTLDDTPLFFPPGMEKLFLAIYIVFLPYIVGLFFLFFYVANSRVELFLSLNEDSSFILTWAIGYEIMAVLVILYIIKMAFGFSRQNSKKGTKEFKRP